MRERITFNGKRYKPVPWFSKDGGSSNECDGCALDDAASHCIFNMESRGSPCNDGGEFTGMIFIKDTKKALAEYVVKRLGVDDDDEYVEDT